MGRLQIVFSLTTICLFITPSCDHGKAIRYTVPVSPWSESFGNHRAVIRIARTAEAVSLDLLWRRHDRRPEEKRFLIVNAETGDTVRNIYRYQTDNERCRLAFGPVKKAGTYYFYYLPFEVQEGWGFYGKDYLKKESEPSKNWLLENSVTDSGKMSLFPAAKVIEIQSRTSFDSFYPMEIIPTQREKKRLLKDFPDEYLLFPEGRENPVRMKDELPEKWVQSGPSEQFYGKADRFEYFAFQIGVYASVKDIKNVKVGFSALKGKNGEIPPSALTCFNAGGIDPYGNPFVKKIDIALGMVQPLWIGADIPREIKPGIYRGIVDIKPENAKARSVRITLNIGGKLIADRGDSEPWRHSRLRWLNSTAGMDDEVVAPYKPLELHGKTIGCLGREVRLNEDGFPEMIKSQGNDLLQDRVRMVVETITGAEVMKNPVFRIIRHKSGIIEWESNSESKVFSSVCHGNMESDGHLHFKYTLIPKKDIQVKDIRLELPARNSFSEYMIGMGLPGGYTPKNHESKWKPTEDSFWIGDPEAGIHCEFLGASYHGPMLNLYKPEPPKSWNNGGKGGFKIAKYGQTTRATAYSGQRELKAAEPVNFEWNFLITPVKPINYKSQFVDRYYHEPSKVIPSEEDVRAGIKIINIHHANTYNPYINYPFIHTRQMKDFINTWHARGMKVKIYYTIRELTNHVTELWALRSMGDEILGDGPGGGYPWLREHLIDHYRPQWYQHFNDIPTDASMVNTGSVNRWYNYYIEGLGWLVKNIGIDGLYLDDVTYDRQILKRMRKVMEQIKPGCIIDLHSNTGFSLGPANQYAEFFPYIDKLWFGESFDYDKMPPENWLVESSGIPFGLMGDMLQGGGNRWRGMIYGMTVRHPWETDGVTCDPRPVWRIWDEFGIESADMIGYWRKDCPVRTTDPDIYATVYVKKGIALISLASWSERTVKVKLHINWKALGIDPDKAVITAPEIMDFQENRIFKPTDAITIEPRKGWLLYLKESD